MAQGVITRDMLNRLKIPLPPLEEQRRIAGILDQADALRRLRTRALDKLNTLGQAIFHEMFGSDWTETSVLGSLGDVIHAASDGPHVSPKYVESGIPFLSTCHVKTGRIVWEDLKFIDDEEAARQWKKCRPTKGDILYSKGGTTGIAAFVDTDADFAVWVHVALLKPKREIVDPTWLTACLNSEQCYRQSQQFTHGIANRDLGLKRMVKIKLPIPPLAAQREFVERNNVLEPLRHKLEAQSKSFDRLFASLQHRAFRGEL